MIYIPLKYLRPGMILARAVAFESSILPLIASGQELTAGMIQRLRELNIAGLYIKSKFCDDITVEEFIDPQYKQKVTSELKVLYTDYMKQDTMSSSMVQSVSEMAQSLMMYVLSKDIYLMNIIDIKDYDTYTYSHSLYVGVLSVLIGIQLGFCRRSLVELATAGLLHDIGKLEIAPGIINKPGELTPEEYDQIKCHPNMAVSRLKSGHGISETVIRGIQSHHERYDGSGYPNGLAGEEIPIFGRILALADVYDALTSSRSYRNAWDSGEAVEYMMGNSSTHFDHNLLQAFLRTIAAYPAGTIVQLSDQSLAVVVKNSQQNTLRPKVRLLLPEESKGKEIDLENEQEYYSLTICGTVKEAMELPDIFQLED